ncbi:MAG: hypothetical protein AAF514_15220 [Verrucomicrobiota bacterium]
MKSALLFGFIAASILSLPSSISGATTFVPSSGFGVDPVAGAAEWDVFSDASGVQSGGTVSGNNAPTSNSLTIDVVAPITPPGGLLGGGDSYYAHSGAYQFEVQSAFSTGVDFARISYALVGTQGAPDPFPIAPSISGATLIRNGFYGDSNNNTIFFSDFDLGNPQTDISARFGDVPQPFSSFRSINGVRIEGLSTRPIPEPSVLLLGAIAAGLGTLRRRR